MTNSDFAALMAESDERTRLAGEFYEMLRRRGEVKSHRVLTYWCPRRCLLADVLNTAQGVIVHHPGYKISPARNEATSNESGRAANTTDGRNHWKPRTYPIGLAVNLTLKCDHIEDHILTLEELENDLATRRSSVTIR